MAVDFNPDDYGNPADDGIPSTWNDLVNAYLNGGPAPPGMTLKQIRALNAAVRGEIREPRQLCNASGGLVAKAGNACYFGQEAVDFANGLLEEDSPDSLKDKAQGWLDSNSNNIVDGQWSEEGTDVSSIADAEAIQEALAQLPEKLKGYITEENIIEVLKTLGGIEDPVTAIKRGMIAGIEFEFPKDWKEWTVFGTLSIPGVPLPPGIVDVTLGEIADAVENMGGTISDFIEGMKNDPLGELKKISDWVIGEVRGVFGGDKDDPGWGGSMGGFGDWVNGVFGTILGGTILGTIYDEVSGYFEGGDSPDPSPPPIGGAEDTSEDATDPTPKQGDDIADLGVDPDLTQTTDFNVGGFDDDDDADDTAGDLNINLGTEEVDDELKLPGGGDNGNDDDDRLDDLNYDDDEDEIGGGSDSDGGVGGGGSSGGGNFEGTVQGLSYVAQPVPGLMSGPPVDAMGELNNLIVNQINKRGMLA
tara:strand:- start:125 stop:1546 length:1422 start_codon:yes stop_codon:yes gene_type:complete